MADHTQKDEIEITSFPIATMIVAAINDPFLKRRYALAEAKRAYRILKKENDKRKLLEIAQVFNWKIKMVKTDTTTPSTVPADYALHFTDYLKNTSSLRETKWKLVNRTMLKGEVNITKDEASRLLAEEIRGHIEKKLEPKLEITLPRNITDTAEKLKQQSQTKRGQIRQEEMPKETVVEAFPPCIRQLYDMAQTGKHLSHIGRFTLTSFLISSGMPVETVVEHFRPVSDFSERMTRYQVEHIAGDRGSRTKYIPPMCDTLRTHGVCPGMDDTCRGPRYPVRHPLIYYRRKARQTKPQAPAAAPRT